MAKRKANELQITRIYDAPVEAVWDAWTDPAQVGQWWGPRGFTLTHHSKDLRPGGHWNYTMHGPDGTDYPNWTTYLEVEKHRRLVYDHGANDTQPPLFRVNVLFTALGERTRMEMTMTLATPEEAERSRKFVKEAGGEATWDRLGEHLAQVKDRKELFIINRSFEAPIQRVYEMWTQPEHLARWLPPKGMEMELIRAELKPGGTSFYLMRGPEMKLYGIIRYLEMRRPDRLVYTQQFCDELGNVSRHPMAPQWPETMRTTVMFTEEDGEHTRVTVTWEPAEGTKPEELRAFIQMRGSMTQGWTGSFDKLEAIVALRH